MVKMSVLNDALKSICNAEKAGKRQVNPSLFSQNAALSRSASILPFFSTQTRQIDSDLGQASLRLV